MSTACWFRCDLRTHDNPALAAACQAGARYALYVISAEQWARHDDAPAKLLFWRESLKSMVPQLTRIGLTLELLVVPTWDHLAQQLVQFCREHEIKALHCNREQGVYERRRDREAYSALKACGVDMVGHDGQTLFVPGSLKTGAGDFYRVFTPFSRAALTRLAHSSWMPLPSPDLIPDADRLVASVASKLDEIDQSWPALDMDGGFVSRLLERWPASETVALQRLENFVADRIVNYHSQRDFPAEPGTSALSPYLAAGLLSPRQCLHAAVQANGGELLSGLPGIRSWINELLWREFYRHLIFGFPKLSMHKPLREQTEAVQWRDAPDDFTAWCAGRTGIPIVDAAMNQLRETGWMHNRLRMIVAMFLTKNLLIDWRLGESYFMQHLVDGDLAANNGGWQWSASTGADSAPYFRVFNPVSQSQKFDPDGRFLRRWLPELSSLDNRSIHDPSQQQRARLGYPEPIVDLKSSRLRAIAAFESLGST